MHEQTVSTPALAAHAPRLLHTMLAVRDLDAMLGFYCGMLGMHEIRRIEFPAERYTLVFIGFDGTPDAPQVEFRHDWGAPPPAAPAPRWHGHLGIGVRDIDIACASLAARGVPIRRAPAPMRPGGRVIALIEDPEGNEVELLAL
jgi:lactoylglutathione lyase